MPLAPVLSAVVVIVAPCMRGCDLSGCALSFAAARVGSAEGTERVDATGFVAGAVPLTVVVHVEDGRV